MVGTLFNTVTVAAGAGLGLALGGRLSESLRQVVFQCLGLFTLSLGIRMTLDAQTVFAIFLALIAGAVLGNAFQLDRRIQALAGSQNPGEGSALVQAVVLFCAGAMTLIGCMQDGLQGDATVLFIKGSMDFVSSAFLAAALGRGVLWAAPAVLILQGSLTWGFATWGATWSDILIADLTGFGGILLLALGIDLLKIRTFALVNFLPGFLLIPVFQPVAHWIENDLPTFFLF